MVVIAICAPKNARNHHKYSGFGEFKVLPTRQTTIIIVLLAISTDFSSIYRLQKSTSENRCEFRKAQKCLYLSTLLGLWPVPRCFSDRKGTSWNRPNNKFSEPPKSPRPLYLQHLSAFSKSENSSVGDPKTNPKRTPKPPWSKTDSNFEKRSEHYKDSDLGAFDASEGVFRGVKIDAPESQKTRMFGEQKA